MSPDDIRLLVDQALVLIENIYVHLPLKRAMHAVDPVQRLHLLRNRADAITNGDFHREMVPIFKQLRDLHTLSILPQPYQSRIAFLPFELGEYFEGDERRYVVTRVKPKTGTTSFKVGVPITHWNGTPIRRAVELNAEREAGSNPEARLAQGLASLTQRQLAVSLPPDEEWVEVTFRAGGRSKTQRFEWQIFALKPGVFADPLSVGGSAADLFGLNVQVELERCARKLLFDPEAVQLVVALERVAQVSNPTMGLPSQARSGRPPRSRTSSSAGTPSRCRKVAIRSAGVTGLSLGCPPLRSETP